MDFSIIGDDLQLVEITLGPHETVRSEAGAMIYMTGSIQMDTNTGGGIWKGIKRKLSGDSFFVTTYTNDGAKPAKIGLASPYPGKIIPIDLSEHNGQFLCQRDAFLSADSDIDAEIAFSKRLGTWFFGGEGFILQRLIGQGHAFIQAGGTVIEHRLEAGEKIRVDTGCIAAFSSEVDYNIEFVGGMMNAIFGQEGFFLATLTGPGTVYLQSMPFSRLAGRIQAAIRTPKGESQSGSEQSGNF
jgi:uncharacterized protein (TIGR00266 family)